MTEKQAAVYESVILEEINYLLESYKNTSNPIPEKNVVSTNLMLSICKLYTEYSDKERTKVNLSDIMVNAVIYSNIVLNKPFYFLLEEALKTNVEKFKVIKLVKLGTFLCDEYKEYIINEATFINLIALLLCVITDHNMSIEDCFKHINVDPRLFS